MMTRLNNSAVETVFHEYKRTMFKLLLSIVVVALAFAGSADAVDGLEMALSVHQVADGDDVLLYHDTTTVVQGIMKSGFLLFFSTDIELVTLDSSRAQFIVHTVTLGPPARTSSRSFSVEYGLPAKLSELEGKSNNKYTFTVVPVRQVDVDTAYCPFNHHGEAVYSVQPTAHTDLHFVLGSYAEFYWPLAKSLVEYDYRRFKALFRFTLPGKFDLFLNPCMIHSVIWDRRFALAVDPTRSTTFVVMNPDVNSLDPFVVNQTALLRSWGYAPPFLTEGAANYLAYAVYDMKQLVAGGQVPPLDSLLDTYAFFEADPAAADRMATTFVKYLIDSRGMTQFKDVYAAADDVNLKAVLEGEYEVTLAELEADWLNYVDTFTVKFPHLAEEAERSEALSNYSRMADYAQAMLDMSPGRIDSSQSLTMLKQAHFFNGEYYKATEAAQLHVDIESDMPRNWMTLAAYQMMNGLYGEAQENLLNARAVDSSDQMVKFNLALHNLYQADTTTAESLFVEIISNQDNPTAQAESRMYLGHILLQQDEDSARAMTYFAEASRAYQQELQVNQAASSAYLWLGVGMLGMGDTEQANTAFQTARFLETRPFYVGMANLWLGRLYDQIGDHQAARDYYGAVLAGQSADYHQVQARYYLDHPYQR